jgi:hypothetical protein
MIGDSLTRYQFASLAHFLETGAFPARFRRPNHGAPCQHVDGAGNLQCASAAHPSVVLSDEWGSWDDYFRGMGGGDDGGVMNGHLESASVRAAGSAPGQDSDNFLYAHGTSRAVLSYSFEAGWGDHPRPLQGYRYTNCSFAGSCRKSADQMRALGNRSMADDFDWQQPFPEAIYANGTLRAALPSHHARPPRLGRWRQRQGQQQQQQPRRQQQRGSGFRRPVLLQVHHQRVRLAQGRGLPGGAADHSVPRVPGRVLLLGLRVPDRDLCRPRCGRAGRHRAQDRLPRLGTCARTCSMPVFLCPTGPPFSHWFCLSMCRSILSCAGGQVHYQSWVYEELNQVLLNVLCNGQ